MTAFLHTAGVPHREVAAGEWGVRLDDVGGRPLEIGLRLSDGLLRLQAWVAPAGLLDPHVLLHRNRLGTLVRFAESRAGEVHVHVDLPAAGLDAAVLDRAFAALVEAAEVARTRVPIEGRLNRLPDG